MDRSQLSTDVKKKIPGINLYRIHEKFGSGNPRIVFRVYLTLPLDMVDKDVQRHRAYHLHCIGQVNDKGHVCPHPIGYAYKQI